jgi:hypothetical protein
MRHQLMQALLGQEEFEVEKEVIYRGKEVDIICHPDLVYKKDGAIIEKYGKYGGL